jgi:Chlorophyll A-B binding protein
MRCTNQNCISFFCTLLLLWYFCAVLATLGYFVAELWHPLYDGKIPAGLAAIGQVPAAGWLQIIAAIGIIELTVGKQDYENKGPGELGEFGQAFNPFKDDPEAFAALQVARLTSI